MSNNNAFPTENTQELLTDYSTVISSLGKTVIYSQDKQVAFKSIQVLLLIVYLTEIRTAVSREALAQLFWPERELKDGLKLLTNLFSRINKLLPNYLTSYTDAKGINYLSLSALDNASAETTFVDSLEFKKLLEQDDIASLEKASGLYKGEFLTGVEVKGNCQELEQWLEHSRLGYQERYINLLHKLIEQACNQQHYEKALSYAQDLLILKPFDDDLNRLALELYTKLNNRLGLINHYSYLAQRTSDEFGVEVDAELANYYKTLLQSFNAANQKPIGKVEIQPTVDYSALSLPYYEIFVGRQSDLENLRMLLTKERLLSIVGMAGIGKSTLLLELLKDLEQEKVFTDGIVVIPRDITNGFDLLDYLASELKLSKKQSSRQDVLQVLKDKNLLLAFDSTATLQDEYHLLEDIIHKTTTVRIIGTSLEPIALDCEVIYHLNGLDFSQDSQEPEDFQDICKSSTAQLFLHHAKKVLPNFDLQEESLSDFSELCRLSQGSPLIISIAASWIDILSLKEIATSLLDLNHQHNDIEARHKSIEAIFERLWQSQQTLEKEHYLVNQVNNGGITVMQNDLESFINYAARHPLYSQYCLRKL